MASNLIRKYPIDNQPRKAVGVGIPFNSSGVFKLNYTTEEQIRDNLINFFLTNRGERVFNPTFGGGLRELVFEQLSNQTLDNLEDLVREQLELYFPRIIINNLELNTDPDFNTLNLVLYYSVSQTNINGEININF